MINVQFTDNTETTICSVFSCPQDEIAYPNQGQILDTDARYESYILALPSALKINLL